MREIHSSGSVRGVRSDPYPYRDIPFQPLPEAARLFRDTARRTTSRPKAACGYVSYLGGRTFIGGAPQSLQVGLTGRAVIFTSRDGSTSTLGFVGPSVGSPEI